MDSRDTSGATTRRAFLGRWGAALLGLAVALGVTVRTHLFFVLPYATPVSNDEGYLAAMALRMVQGHWLPYVDGVSQRGPILYWLTTAVMRSFGLWSWVPMRMLGLGLALAVVALTFALAATLFSPMAGAVAALAVSYFLNYELNPWDGVGVNGEPVAVAFALTAALVVARAQIRGYEGARRTRALVVAGALSACAGLSKQMFIFHAAPLVAWILLGPPAAARPPSFRARLRELALFAAGGVGPYAVVVAIYAAAGHLGTFLYYYQRYGREIFMDPVTADYIRDKVREQVDKYFLGIAGLAGVWLVAVARALRATLAARPADDDGAVDAAADDPGVARLRFAPESHVLLNVALPGAGLAFVPGRRALGLAALALTVITLAARAALRAANGVPYTAVAATRDGLIWLGAGALTAAVTVALVARRFPSSRWSGVARLRAHAVPWFAVAQMLVAFGGACFTFRFFPHYFVEFFPFAAVVLGGVVAESFAGLDADDRPGTVSALTIVIGASALLVVANTALQRNVRLRRETDRWYQDPAADPIVRYVIERTTPNQKIFVWGFRAETYVSARRWPGSRYVYTVYPAGVVPWFQANHEEEDRRVVPGSREQLLEDLERERPELVVDAGRSMSGRYMYNYPRLRAYLDRNYCFMRYVDGEPVYRRRHGERCPPADY